MKLKIILDGNCNYQVQYVSTISEGWYTYATYETEDEAFKGLADAKAHFEKVQGAKSVIRTICQVDV